jgi:hypothetical protein
MAAKTALARRISGVAIFPCDGGRDQASQQALAAAFDKTVPSG